jgi:hypothetical protein
MPVVVDTDRKETASNNTIRNQDMESTSFYLFSSAHVEY